MAHLTNGMKILYVTSVYPRWAGDATPPFVQNQAELMGRQGWDIHVLAPHAKGAKLRENADGLCIYRHRYFLPSSLQCLCYEGGMLVNFRRRPWTKWLLPFFCLSQILSGCWLCLKLKPEIIHSHSLLPQGLTGCLLSKIFRIPHITTSHGNDVFGLKQSGIMGLLKKEVIHSASAITVNSSATKQAIMELGADEPKVCLVPAVPNEAEVSAKIVDQIVATYGQCPRILFVGRLIHEKGILVLIESVALALKEIPDLQCLVVGDGELRSEAESLVGTLGVGHAVEFIGWRSREEVPSWMAAADALVVPSQSVGTWQEAQGLVVVEAMLVGTPVVASNIGGIPDMIEDGVTGRLTVPGDAPLLSGAIIQALIRHEDAGRMAQVAQARAQKSYSSSAVSSLLGDVYNQSLEAYRCR